MSSVNVRWEYGEQKVVATERVVEIVNLIEAEDWDAADREIMHAVHDYKVNPIVMFMAVVQMAIEDHDRIKDKDVRTHPPKGGNGNGTPDRT